MSDIKQSIIEYLKQCEAYAYVPDAIEFIENELNGMSIVPADKVLWRDVEEGEKMLPGDRCCGRDHKWFDMDSRHFEYSEVIEAHSYPVQRKVQS